MYTNTGHLDLLLTANDFRLDSLRMREYHAPLKKGKVWAVVGEGLMPSHQRAGINPAPTVGACGRRPGEGDFRLNDTEGLHAVDLRGSS